MKTWIFAKPEATGSNGWAGKAIVAGLEITSVDRAPAFYDDDAKLIASAPALQAENEQLKPHIETLKKEKADEVLRSRYWEERWFAQAAELGTANRLIDELRLHLKFVCNIAARLGPSASNTHREEALQMLDGTIAEAEAVWRKSEKRKDEAGNPWAPNKDYPRKPVDICICPRCGLQAHDNSCDTGK